MFAQDEILIIKLIRGLVWRRIRINGKSYTVVTLIYFWYNEETELVRTRTKWHRGILIKSRNNSVTKLTI
jgi:hypothetical protein